MFQIGSFRAAGCGGTSRRAFLQASFGLPLLGSPLLAADKPVAPRARSVILLWLWGGPSHLDTFDPKPDAPATVRGPFSTIGTRIPGIRFSELFPRLAARNDRFSLVFFACPDWDAPLHTLGGQQEQQQQQQPGVHEDDVDRVGDIMPF